MPPCPPQPRALPLQEATQEAGPAGLAGGRYHRHGAAHRGQVRPAHAHAVPALLHRAVLDARLRAGAHLDRVALLPAVSSPCGLRRPPGVGLRPARLCAPPSGRAGRCGGASAGWPAVTQPPLPPGTSPCGTRRPGGRNSRAAVTRAVRPATQMGTRLDGVTPRRQRRPRGRGRRL